MAIHNDDDYYSRKVEYLHELVLNTLSIISERRAANQSNVNYFSCIELDVLPLKFNVYIYSTLLQEEEDNAKREHNHVEEDFENNDDCMLILDDDVKLGKNIDLQEDQDALSQISSVN